MPKDEHLKIEQQLIEFCKEPRTLHEIKEYMPLDSTKDAIRRHLLNPLIDQGKINRTIPNDIDALHQMYINAEVKRTPEIEELIQLKSKSKKNIELEEKVLKYCKEPRTMKEILKHLKLSCSTGLGKRILRPLIAEGKLRFRYQNNGSNQQYVNSETKLNFISEESLIEFCKTPRLVKEIREHFNITIAVYQGMAKSLRDTGKLVYTEEYEKVGKFNVQRRLKSNG